MDGAESILDSAVANQWQGSEESVLADRTEVPDGLDFNLIRNLNVQIRRLARLTGYSAGAK